MDPIRRKRIVDFRQPQCRFLTPYHAFVSKLAKNVIKWLLLYVFFDMFPLRLY